VRRLADIVIAGAVLLITLPLMVGVALAIRLESPGPVFERERRLNRGRRFTPLTFRTTTYDPEGLTPKWLRNTTPIGRFLRYTRIDLLPRLINVIRGEISLREDALFEGLFWE
jgi:lipopolysaccharide/colanic/teichoic acid biosynthesis glycosyltransferase